TFAPTQVNDFQFQTTSSAKVMKEPRRIEVSGTRDLVLSLRGDTGKTLAGNVGTPPFRFSLFRFDWSNATSQTIENDLGSTNMGLAIASTTGDAFVAGSVADNGTETTANLKADVVNGTGFVTSQVWRVTPALAVETRDLNLDPA